MWNINYAIPSLLVLCIFLGYYFTLPRIPVRMNRIFVYLILVEFLVMLTDIVSTWACINYDILPVILVYLLNAIYFILFFARAYSFYLFTASVLRSSWGIDRKKRIIAHIPVVVLSAIVVSSPWHKLFFYVDETGYHSGKLYNLLYVLFAYFLLLSIGLIIRKRHNVRRKREFNSVCFYNMVLTIGLVFRYVFPKYLLMDTFCILALSIIYLSFGNPDFYLEARTWIFNSRGFRELIEEINNEKKYTVFGFIIDNYKDIRELYGNRQMDQGISLIGDYLRKAFPSNQIFYYRDGRFIILGDYGFDYKEAYNLIKNEFKTPWLSDDAELYLDIVAMVIHFGDHKLRVENVLSIISESFEKASESEEDNVVVIGNDIIDFSTRQTDIKRTLKYAIEQDRVKVFLQPIVNSKTGRLEGAEALTRIIDTDGKIVPPSLFIPIAEKNGMISHLGERVFEHICKFIKTYDVKGMGLSWINVNLSPIQLLRSDIADRLFAYTKKYDVDPGFIHLEITEEAMIDEALLLKRMDEITAKGFYFVLDDYGKGYSNISRVKKCSFINIKLDMSVVSDHCQKPDALLPAMVSTFRTLGFNITAEGIENEDMAKKMAEIGVDYLQGFYFSRPIPIEEFVSRYEKR